MKNKIEGIKTISSICEIFKWICLFFSFGFLVFAFTISETSVFIASLSSFGSVIPLWCLEKFFYALYVIALGSLKNIDN